jgi:hypothetical protein
MAIFEQLQENKGTTSSALGKKLATQVINGENEILLEAIQLVKYDINNPKSKNIRAGAAKIIEKVAEKHPEYVSPYLKDLLPALEVEEPQTRWMIIMTFGYCANLNPKLASKGIPFARRYISEKQGVCLSGAAELYLGFIGANSTEFAESVLPVLIDAYNEPLPNEMDWILEAFLKIINNVTPESKYIIIDCATEQLNAFKPSTRNRATKLLRKFKEK